jgi:tartrate dehydrogenase/decarboxylase/D-malate dehydrogenase
MTTYRIAVIPGDGIGREVTPAAIRVLEAVSSRAGFRLEWEQFPWGSEHYVEHGRMMPADGLDRLRPFDAIFFGAVGDPRLQDNVTLNGLLLPIRRGFDQYACVRPAVLYPGVRCPLAGRQPGEIDVVVVRENTEGEYAQIGGQLYSGGAHEVAVQAATFTRHGTERVMRFAFDLARRRNRKRLLTSVTKSNAQGFSMEFWDRVFREVAREYADVRTESLLVDAACMDLVRRPQDFDVIVASNLFGDILTDLSAAITGSLGLAPSANLNPPRTYPSMFEPVHGSAPDIAGRGVANPMAAMLAGSMMLDFLGQPAAAAAIENAVLHVLADPRAVTPDLGGAGTTHTVTEAVAAAATAVTGSHTRSGDQQPPGRNHTHS